MDDQQMYETKLTAAIVGLINNQISKRIDALTEAKSFDIEDYRGDIETMISEYINYNVTVTIEG